MIPLSRISPAPVRNPADIQRLTPDAPPLPCGTPPSPLRISSRFPASPNPLAPIIFPFRLTPFPLFAPLFFPFRRQRKRARISSQPSKFGGGRWATRTPGLWFRRPTLYPPELIARLKNHIRFRSSVKTDRTGAALGQDLLPGKGALPGPGQSHNLMASKGPWFTGGVRPRATHRRPSAG